jgi:pilus assembly protein CpaF
MQRLQDGSRRIMNIAEVVGAHDDQVELQEIFTFERAGVTDQGKVKGVFRSTGIRPKLLERLRLSGINLPDTVFTETTGYRCHQIDTIRSQS